MGLVSVSASSSSCVRAPLDACRESAFFSSVIPFVVSQEHLPAKKVLSSSFCSSLSGSTSSSSPSLGTYHHHLHSHRPRLHPAPSPPRHYYPHNYSRHHDQHVFNRQHQPLQGYGGRSRDFSGYRLYLGGRRRRWWESRASGLRPPSSEAAEDSLVTGDSPRDDVNEKDNVDSSSHGVRASSSAAVVTPPRSSSDGGRDQDDFGEGRGEEGTRGELAEAAAPRRKTKIDSCAYINADVATGQSMEHSANLVIYGDVQAGASVAASGDVVVLGKLLGEATAGKDGDPDAQIFAIEMAPEVLRIAHVTQAAPFGRAIAAGPEVAQLSTNDSKIRVFPAHKHITTTTTTTTTSTDPAAVSDNENGGPTQREGYGGRDAAGMRGMLKGLQWSRAAKAALWTGCYIYVVGILTVLFPKKVFGLLFTPADVSEGWIRVLGILAVVFGMYYAGAAIGDAAGQGARGFYASTVVGRQMLCWGFCVLVIFKAVQPGLLLLAGVNLLGALWMKWSLSRDQE
ncbi:hypothetical protein CBR_g36662 [Chara braunii]|uniref:Septum formation inhibitor MinC C-terminal domain-containing protein n=1 Tax=Chara braunii TaxID=69332 RepID=A0A388LL65_CHABU|nr:hypothetical protein CBR_g36662 [Chara braunii]|eukprot:GBG83044.1 hypothetical protein CBR_g36662 [Chara braunii]